MILCYLLFNLWACIAGFKEAALFSKKGSAAFWFDIHRLFVGERICVFLIMCSGICLEKVEIFTLLPACVLSFPFYHDGFYYIGRHYTDVEEYNFASESKSSTAVLEFNFPMRCLLKIISVSIIVLYIIIYESIL